MLLESFLQKTDDRVLANIGATSISPSRTISRRSRSAWPCCGGAPSSQIDQLERSSATEPLRISTNHPPVLRIAAGEDHFGEYRGLGISSIAFKVVPQNSDGLLILENIFRAKGGPARHLYYDQDKWFYAVEGQFIVEVGQARFTLNPGDSLLAPRQIPHTWADVGDVLARILIAFMPAGQMEANAMLPRDPELWRARLGVAGPADVRRVRTLPAVMLDLETLIHAWYWDEASHQFAREAGAFLLQFMHHFQAAGASESEIQKNLDNVWLIGALLCQNDLQESFSPEAFLNEPLFIDQFRFRMRAFPDEVASYEITWHELKRYVRGMGYGDD